LYEMVVERHSEHVSAHRTISYTTEPMPSK
jgi:hypothetical protein